MNIAIFIIPMKSAWYKVSNKHLNFEIRSSDTWEPPSYTHIQTSMFWILRESYDFSDEFFLINWGISKVFHAKKPCTSQILRSKIFKKFLSVGNCSSVAKKKWKKKKVSDWRWIWTPSQTPTFFFHFFFALRKFLKILDPQKSKTRDFFASKTFEIPKLMKKKFISKIIASAQNSEHAHLYMGIWWWFLSIWWAIFKS